MRFYSDSRARFKYAIDTQQKGTARSLFYNGGEGGIRTLDTRLTYTPLAGERLQPLGHFSVFVAPFRRRETLNSCYQRAMLVTLTGRFTVRLY